MNLVPWQLEAFAEIHNLSFPPPEWSTAAVERAAKPTLWVEIAAMDYVVDGRPSVCPMPLPWALWWLNSRDIEVMHLPQFEDAFLGIGVFPKSQPCMIYNKSKLVDAMIDETEDYGLGVSLFESKLSKAYYGSGSPGFLTGFEF